MALPGAVNPQNGARAQNGLLLLAHAPAGGLIPLVSCKRLVTQFCAAVRTLRKICFELFVQTK
jgi:hypothetical protein